MADIKLNNLTELTQATQLTSTKNLLIFDGTSNTGNRITFNNLAKAIIESYSGSTLAGSARSPKAAIDALNTAIGNANTNIGNIRYYYANIGTSYTSLLERVQAVIDRSDYPLNYQVVGVILSGSYHTCNGFLDTNKNGFIIFGNYTNGHLFSVEDGTAKIVSATKTEVDTLNSNIETKDLGSKSTLSDFNNGLTALANSMNSQQTYKIRIVANSNTLSPFQYATYYGTLTKNTSTSFFANLSCGLDEIHGEYTNDNWVWEKTSAKSYSLSGGTVITANTDLNNITTVGNYYAYTQVSIVNGPMSAFSGILKVEHSAGQNDGYLRQTLIPYNSNNRYERVYNNTQWLDWEKRPSREEITAINSKYLNNAGSHNCIYRGKNLGTSVTSAQWTAISAGTFDDLYIGDYWVINGVTWRIAAFNYWYNRGNPTNTTNHVVIVPDSCLLSGDGSTTHYLNSEGTTDGGYKGTGFYSGVNKDGSTNTAKTTCISIVNNAFNSSHILTYRDFLSNDAIGSGGEWTNSNVELMTEQMVFGYIAYEKQAFATYAPGGIPSIPAHTISGIQLPLFSFAPQYISNHENWWLRNVVSETRFSGVRNEGFLAINQAGSASYGIRPCFGIC